MTVALSDPSVAAGLALANTEGKIDLLREGGKTAARRRSRPRASGEAPSVERLPVVLALTPDAERTVEHLLFGRAAVLEPRASAAEADELEQEVHGRPRRRPSSSRPISPASPPPTAPASAPCGVRVAGLARDAQQRQELLALGVDEIVEPTDSEQAFLAALRGRVDRESLRRRALPSRSRGAAARAPARRETSGSVLAVIGSKGAPGASECAASLAALGRRALAVRPRRARRARRRARPPARRRSPAGLAARTRPRRGRRAMARSASCSSAG